MFRRLKNLWAISNHSIDELKNPVETIGYMTTSTGTDSEYKQFNPVTIVDLKTSHPFDAYETTE